MQTSASSQPAHDLSAATEQPLGGGRPGREKSRLLWADVARGIGIILVVYAHAIRGLVQHQGAAPGWALWQDRVIYTFHMPLFFVLAGLFLWPSLERGRKAFLKDRSLTVLYPYFLWSLAIGVLQMIARPYVNSPVSPADLVAIPWWPIEQFWFLYALFTLQIIALLIFPRRLLLVAAAIVLPFVPTLFASAPYVLVTLTWLPFLVLGLLLSPALGKVAGAGRSRIALLAAAGWLLFAGVVALGPGVEDPMFFYAAGSIGAAATLLSAMLVREGRAATGLAWLGAGSMAIFVMHSAASAGIRALIGMAWPGTSFAVQLLATFAAGMLFPALVYWQAKRLGVLTWLGLGRDRPRASATPAKAVLA